MHKDVRTIIRTQEEILTAFCLSHSILYKNNKTHKLRLKCELKYNQYKIGEKLKKN